MNSDSDKGGRLCATCANVRRAAAGYITACAAAPEDGKTEFQKVVLATINGNCDGYCPQESQKPP